MKKGLFILSSTLLLYMSSCMLGPDFQKPDIDSPAAFRFDTVNPNDSMINLRWWELFEDPLLDTLIVHALENNRDVLATAARVDAARSNIGFTKADQWPSFSYITGTSSSGIGSNNTNNFYAYPELVWEVGFWGKYRRLNEAARAQYVASEYGKRSIQISLITAVASSYFTILAINEQLRISVLTLESRNNGLIIMMDKYEGGTISEMDVNQAKIQRDIAATVIPGLKRAIALNENSLSILIGENPKVIETGPRFIEQEYKLDIPIGMPSEILERRPDIRAAEAAYEAQNAQVGVAEALRWPSLSLTGLLGVASNDLSSLNAAGLAWSSSANLLGPIFQFGKNKRRVDIARYNTYASLMEYESTVLQAFKEVEDALVKINTYEEEMLAQESRSLTAMSSESLSMVRYAEGLTTYLEVLEQQRQSFGSQLDYVLARLNVLNSYILLYKSLGGGWLSSEEETIINNSLDSLQFNNN